MSRYFQTLKRLQTGPPSAAAEAAANTEFPEPGPAAPLHTFPEIASQPTKVRTAFSGLLDSLRLVPQSPSGRCVVIAGVSRDSGIHSVQAGLEAQAEQTSANLVTGRLQVSGGRRFLEFRRFPPRDGLRTGMTTRTLPLEDSLALDLDADDLSQALKSRIETVHPDTDVTILLGPPLADSVDSALIARATSGLVLVLKPLVTQRSDLFLALTRAERSGCAVLGVVVLGAPQKLPSWLSRMIDGSGRSDT